MRAVPIISAILACWLTACGPSRSETFLVQPVALGERLYLGRDFIFPAKVRANEAIAGRLVFTADSVIFEAEAKDDASRRWEYRNIRGLHRPNPNELVLEPFDGSGYMFELAGPGLVEISYKAVLGRLALARYLR